MHGQDSGPLNSDSEPRIMNVGNMFTRASGYTVTHTHADKTWPEKPEPVL